MSDETSEWYYESGGAAVGPVSAAEFAGKRAVGVIVAETRVWRTGMPEWLALSAVADAPSEVPLAPSQPVERCAECSLLVPADEILEYGNLTVCTACKDTFVDKLKLGVRVGEGPWRSGRILIFQGGSELPKRCVKCNAPGEHPVKKNLAYISPYLLFLILLGGIGIIIYIIVGLIIRKRAKVTAYFCSTHRKQRMLQIASTWTIFGLGILAIIIGIVLIDESDKYLPILPIGLLLLLISAIFGICIQLFRVKKIENDVAKVRGAREPFLSSLQQWHES